jgi:hypothetical protein
VRDCRQFSIPAIEATQAEARIRTAKDGDGSLDENIIPIDQSFIISCTHSGKWSNGAPESNSPCAARAQHAHVKAVRQSTLFAMRLVVGEVGNADCHAEVNDTIANELPQARNRAFPGTRAARCRT